MGMGRRWAVQLLTAALLLAALLWVRGWPGPTGVRARAHVRSALTASAHVGRWGTREGILGWISGAFGVAAAKRVPSQPRPTTGAVRPPAGIVPVTGALDRLFSRAHPATLWRVSPRARVRSAWAGVVTRIAPGEPYADEVQVRSPDGLVAEYGGLAPVRVHRGQRVRRGAVLGDMAPVGPGVVSRLRFAVRVSGRPVDPLAIGLR